MLLQHSGRQLDISDPRVLEHAVECQLAAWMCVFGVTNAGFGLSHALGHQIGPRWNVPHGMTSCITLPHAMRFMADLRARAVRPIAEGFGVAFDPAEPKARRAGLRRPRGGVHRAVRRAAAAARRRRAARTSWPTSPRVVHDVMDAAHVVDRLVTRDDIASLLARAY